MADEDFSEQLEELYGYDKPRWDPLLAVGSTLSMVSCGLVMATVMLASDLRKASWAPYLLLWALAQLLLKLLHVIEVTVMQVHPIVDRAVYAACEFYHFLYLALLFLSMTTMAALSLDLLVSSVKPSGWGRRGPRYVVVGLLLASITLYVPNFAVNGKTYRHNYFMCVVMLTGPSARYLMLYFQWTISIEHLLGSLVVFVGGVGFWCLEMRKRERSQDLRLLAPFLLGFAILNLPSSIAYILNLSGFQFSKLKFLLTLFLLCLYLGPVVLLGCLTTSSIFRRALKTVFLPLSCRRRNDPGRLMTEMTQVGEETTKA